MSDFPKLYFGVSDARAPHGWQWVPHPSSTRLRTAGPERHTNLDLAGLLASVPTAPAREITEFFSIISTVYIADLWMRRKGHARDGWTRHLTLDIPVTTPQRWGRDEVIGPLRNLLRFVTCDTWDIRFRLGDNIYPDNTPLSGLEKPATAVALFSGGLDSYCHAATLESSTVQSTVLISHGTSGNLPRRQSELRQSLPGHPRLAPFKVQVNRFGNQPNEPSQRTRGLLFIAAGLLVCSGNGVTELTVPENGFLSVNPPLTASRPGASMTKSVHPLTMRLINTILTEIGATQRVENPFALRTKGEICQESIRNGVTLRDLARTVSCSHPETRTKGKRFGNCGYCYPCLIRHASLRYAGGDLTDYRDHDPAMPTAPGSHRAALRDWLEHEFTIDSLIAASPLPSDTDLTGLADVIRRSRSELNAAFP